MTFLAATVAATAAATTSAGTGKNPSTSGSTWTLIIYFAIIAAAMYFILIRPQKKKQKKEDKMRNSIQVGDEILTIGGLYGKVIAIKEDSYIVESGPDRSKIRVAKWSMQQNMTVHEDEVSDKGIIKK